MRAGPAIATSGYSVNCRPATSVREVGNEKTLRPVVLRLMSFNVIDRVLDNVDPRYDHPTFLRE
jgi:hypothetical protein